MKSLKDNIRDVLKSKIDLKYVIKPKQPDKEDMNKAIFIQVIDELKKIEDRKDFLADEIGIDMTLYEDQFFSVIENLFKLIFNKSQLELIQLYLYELVPDKEWDGTIKIEQEKQEQIVPFKTPSDVWEIVKKFQK